MTALQPERRFTDHPIPRLATPSFTYKEHKEDTEFVHLIRDHINTLVDNLKQPQPNQSSVALPTDQVDYSKLLLSAEVHPTDHILKPPVCLAINHGGQQSTICTLGNLSLVIGKAKSRKTFAVSIALAAAVKQGEVLNRLVGTLPVDQPNVLYFDTEQGRYHVHRAVKRVCDLSGISEPSHLKTYALRSYPTETRLEIIRWALYNTPGLGLVVIDGIRDLVFDINSPQEATKIATELLKWTDDLKIHILVVLHQNKGNTDARGHLGTELINKAETVITVSRDNDSKEISKISPEYCREKDFEPFAFSIDEYGLPFLLDESPASNETTRRIRKLTAATLTPQEVQNIIQRAFANDSQLQYSLLRTNIIEASEYYGVTLSKTRTEGFIASVLNDGYLIKAKTTSQRYSSYQINSEKVPF